MCIFEPYKNVSKMRDKSPPPILVLGMHNSGTSILAKVMHKSGVFMGNNMAHCESHFFSEFINDKLIMGGEDRWAKLPIMNVEEIKSHESKVKEIIKKGWIYDYMQWGYNGVSRWGIKDPRLCVLIPLYLDIFPESKIVHIRRDPKDVAASLSQKYKKGVGLLDDPSHWFRLTREYNTRVEEFSGKAKSYYDLKYEDLCKKTQSVISSLFTRLELKISDQSQQLIETMHTDSIGSYKRYKKSPIKLRKLSSIFRRLVKKYI
jgi:hypothetical protein